MFFDTFTILLIKNIQKKKNFIYEILNFTSSRNKSLIRYITEQQSKQRYKFPRTGLVLQKQQDTSCIGMTEMSEIFIFVLANICRNSSFKAMTVLKLPLLKKKNFFC